MKTVIKDFRILNIATWGCIGFVGFQFVSTALRFLAKQYPTLNLILLTVLFLAIAIFLWIVLSPQFKVPFKLDAIETAAVVALALFFSYGDAIVRYRFNRHDSTPTPEQPQQQQPPTDSGTPDFKTVKTVDAAVFRFTQR
ncbi:hypothetical protein IQ235_03955 [Oscillatoriales cyanobacterium LEGE 11467]|uniref:Uncharacterized protein n=1 Tax=Zarconia navalis LEGE 11467 TaxID=1828826 RepID=A0A928VX90_9CYAN|nr:hypothetical protein [Zarconia navalis]MBE9039946.1 hypothetical protein [Zarconia navalis LEGE 11467]